MYLVGDQQERYIIEEISRSLGKFLGFGLGIIYIMVLVPGTVVLAGTLTNRGSDKVGRRSHRYASLLRLEIKNLSCKIASRINLSAH